MRFCLSLLIKKCLIFRIATFIYYLTLLNFLRISKIKYYKMGEKFSKSGKNKEVPTFAMVGPKKSGESNF